VLAIYNARLAERIRRRNFVLERGLLEYKRQQQLERRRPRTERAILSALRPISRFLSAGEAKELQDGLVAEMRLRRRIDELREWRKAGCRTLLDGEEYAQAKKAREEKQRL